MSSTNDDADQLLALLTENDVIDPSLESIFPSTVDHSSSSSASTPRPVNFSSAFSQSSRPRRTSALVASQNIAQSYSNPLAAAVEDFQDYSFLTEPSRAVQQHGGGEGGAFEGEDDHDAIAGPGPNSIAAAVARNAIQGLEQYELPIPPPMPTTNEQPIALASEPRTTRKRKEKVKEKEKEKEQEVVEPVKKKRGRPRTKPEKDPNEPPKKRGRPRKNPEPEPTPPPPTVCQSPSPASDDEQGTNYFPDPYVSESGAESQSGSGEESASDSSTRSSQKGVDGEGTKKKKKKKRKRIAPPLLPRVFRSAKKIEETGEMADLDVNDLMEGKEDLDAVPELTEEQKKELQRAMNPNFSTRLLTALDEHSDYYNRAYKALQEELLAVQVEESLLEHVKEVALEMRNNIRYPLKTMEEIEEAEPTSRDYTKM